MQSRTGRREEETIRIIFQSFIRSEYPDQFVYTVIIWFDVFIANWPVVPKTIDTFAFEIFGTKAQGYASPVIGPATEHSCPPPFPFCIICSGEWFAVHRPSP